MRYTLKQYHQLLVEKLGPDVRVNISAGQLVELLDERDQLRRLAANEPLHPDVITEPVFRIAQEPSCK